MLINNKIILKLKEKSLSLHEYYILYSKYKSTDWLQIWKPDKKTYESLRNRGLLTKTDLTQKSLDILRWIINEKEVSNRFDEWWNTYPSTNAHGPYAKTRTSIRSQKVKCQLLYAQLAKEYKEDDIIKGTENYVQDLKLSSTKENRLTYIKNTYSFLRDKMFLDYMSKSRKTKKTNAKLI